MTRFDVAVLLWLNEVAGINPALDRVIADFTKYAPLVFVFLFVVAFLLPRSDSRKWRRGLLLAALSGVLGLLVAVALASLIYRPRPFVVLRDQVRLLVPHAADSSFPSDHATGSAGFAVGVWPIPNTALRWVFTIVALLVGISRVSAGVHWPTDILGSFLLGGLAARAVWALAKPLTPLLDFFLGIWDRFESRLRHQ